MDEDEEEGGQNIYLLIFEKNVVQKEFFFRENRYILDLFPI